jgi:hypothetical protein
LASVTASPWQTLKEPVIADSAFTVTAYVAEQPVLSVYVRFTTPLSLPLTIPDVEPMAAYIFDPLQTPPVTGSLKVIAWPSHTDVGPAIAASAFIVIDVVVVQPVGITYDMVAVPAAEPLTIPVADPMSAFPLLLLQVPPVAPSARVTTLPWQTLEEPVIGDKALTVTAYVAEQPLPRV